MKEDGEWNIGFAWNVHSYLCDFIKFGDTKAALLCGITGPLTIGLVRYEHWELGWDVASLAGVVAVVCFACSFCIAFAAIWPNVLTRKTLIDKSKYSLNDKKHEVTPRGYIFWESILAHPNARTFSLEFSKLNQEELAQQLGVHSYELAGIADRKYGRVILASRFFAIGLVSIFVFAIWV